MSAIWFGPVEDDEGIVHKSKYGTSTKRIDKPVTRHGTVCYRRVKGWVRDPATCITCMECIADVDPFD